MALRCQWRRMSTQATENSSRSFTDYRLFSLANVSSIPRRTLKADEEGKFLASSLPVFSSRLRLLCTRRRFISDLSPPTHTHTESLLFRFRFLCGFCCYFFIELGVGEANELRWLGEGLKWCSMGIPWRAFCYLQLQLFGWAWFYSSKLLSKCPSYSTRKKESFNTKLMILFHLPRRTLFVFFSPVAFCSPLLATWTINIIHCFAFTQESCDEFYNFFLFLLLASLHLFFAWISERVTSSIIVYFALCPVRMLFVWRRTESLKR